MCGIAGIVNISNQKELCIDTLKSMASVIRHRGPDGFGFYNDKRAGFAHARLSIIDLESGWQPIHNEDKTKWIIFNGEIFNYIELKKVLEEQGHRFYTKSDTEVIIHLYEDYREECLKYLNGQFAFAIWDKKENELFLARDRMGIRPLFYTINNGRFYFASEIKAIFSTDEVDREIDCTVLDQIFTFWHTVPSNTVFKGIYELPPAHYLVLKNGSTVEKQYWDVQFSDDLKKLEFDEAMEALKELLIDAVRLRLRADVPVGAYLSGGLDSSVTTALIKHFSNSPLQTFSVTFEDKEYDESIYQKEMSKLLGTMHHEVKCTYNDINANFPKVIWHSEKPILRTAPTPLFLLSKLVRENNLKVIITGEGADEVLGGYDIFRETKIRQFWARFPESHYRPLLFKRLYPYLQAFQGQSNSYKAAFFQEGLSDIEDKFYSHRPRWNTTSKTKVFFSEALKLKVDGSKPENILGLRLPTAFSSWPALFRAQYLEMKHLLPGYILSSQGDRVSMANSIEGRFPFLDHRVVEFCAKLPSQYKIFGLNEKYLLKTCMSSYLPKDIVQRSKQPYLAPDSKSFFNNGKVPDYVEELLSEDYIGKYGYFKPKTVNLLLKKCKRGGVIGFKDNMAIVGILSTQLLHNQFVDNFQCNNQDIENIRILDEEYHNPSSHSLQ